MKPLPTGPYACLITEGKADPSNFDTEKTKILGIIRDAIADGVNLVQIREKSLPAKLIFDLVSGAVRIIRPTTALVLVNDRPDIAIAAGADGVHLPETSLPAGVVRRTFLRELVIGVSTHTFEQAALAANSGADYIFYGPIFETPGKGQPVGIESLKAVCDSLGSFPVIGLGGIDQENSAEVRSAGASGFAAIRSLNEPQSRRATCAGFNVFSR